MVAAVYNGPDNAVEHFEIVNKQPPEPDTPRAVGCADVLRDFAQQLGVAAANCTGVKTVAHAAQGGFFHGIVDETPIDTADARNLFIIETGLQQ